MLRVNITDVRKQVNENCETKELLENSNNSTQKENCVCVSAACEAANSTLMDFVALESVKAAKMYESYIFNTQTTHLK